MSRALARISCWLPATGSEDPGSDGETPVTKCGRDYAIANVVNNS